MYLYFDLFKFTQRIQPGLAIVKSFFYRIFSQYFRVYYLFLGPHFVTAGCLLRSELIRDHPDWLSEGFESSPAFRPVVNKFLCGALCS